MASAVPRVTADLAWAFVSQGHEMPIPGEMLKRGWGVLRLQPWHLAGVFASSVEAENLAQALGPGYVIKYGDHAPGSTEFSFAAAPTSPIA